MWRCRAVCFECVQLLKLCAVCHTEAFLHMTGNRLTFSPFSLSYCERFVCPVQLTQISQKTTRRLSIQLEGIRGLC